MPKIVILVQVEPVEFMYSMMEFFENKMRDLELIIKPRVKWSFTT